MKTLKRVECHVIAGLGGWLFARGTKALDKMMDDLRPEWDATHWWHQEWQKCAQGIIDRQRKFGDAPTIILIGHSYGALRCQQIAARLNGIGIEVAYVAGIDPTALKPKHPPMLIPKNVNTVHEFWATSGFPKNARRRDPTGGKGGMYQTPHHPSHKPVVIKGGHIPCASNERTRAIILKKVKELI